MKFSTSNASIGTQMRAGSVRQILLAVCLIFSLISVSMPTAVQAEGYQGTYYVVKQGDTLRNIAIAYGTTTYALAHANGLHDINRIEVGQHIYIPHNTGYHPKPAPPPTQPPPMAASHCAAYHTVRYGESLSGIAQWYGVDPYKMAKANHLYDLNHVYAGQQLCIPQRHRVQKPAHVPPTPTPHYVYPTATPHYVYPTATPHYVYPTATPHYVYPTATPHYVYPTATPHYVYPTPNYVAPTPHVAPPHSKYAPERAPFTHDPWANNQGYQHNPHYQPKVPHYQHQYPTPTPHYVYPTPTPVPPKPVHYHNGWKGEYYANTQCAGTPVFTRHDAEINFDWGYGGPGGGLWNDMFSVEWTTDAHFSAGDYKFYALADDGVRVYVDNQLVIDGWKVQGKTEYTGNVWLGEGYHHVKVQYFEQTHAATVKVHWSR